MEESREATIIAGLLGKVNAFVDSYPSRDEDLQDAGIFVTIDKNRLDDEITKCAARFAWIAVVAEEARHIEAMAKKEWETHKVLVAISYRNGTTPPPDGYGKLTETSISELVDANLDVFTSQNNYLEARGKAMKLGKMVEAMSLKSDMLRTFASNQRNELKSDFSVKQQVVKDMFKNSPKNSPTSR